MSPTLYLNILVKRSYACEHVCRVDLVRKLVFEHHSPALLTSSDLTVVINGFSVVVATSRIEFYDFIAEQPVNGLGSFSECEKIQAYVQVDGLDQNLDSLPIAGRTACTLNELRETEMTTVALVESALGMPTA